MAAVVAGTTHAPLTAILILFELTRDVYVLLPIMLAAVMSTLSAQVLARDSIYTLKLRRRGVLVGSAADLTILRRLTARAIAPTPHVSVHPDDPLSKLSQLRGHYHVADFVVTDHEGRYLGMVTGTDMRTALMEPEAIPYLLVEELLRRDLPTIHPEETLDTVLEKFSKHDVSSLPLLAAGPGDRQIAALITRARLMRRYQEELEKS
jgi:CIC family chloride channel protein